MGKYYLYFPYQERQPARRGIGWVNLVFRKSFPDAEELYTLDSFSKLGRGDILFIPRIFPQPMEGTHPHLIDALCLANATMSTKAIVVQTLFWDGEVVPPTVLSTLGKVDILHAPSKFVESIFRGVAGLGSVVVGIPIKDFPRRERVWWGQPTCLGIIASWHPRKNLLAYVCLANNLPNIKFRLVMPGSIEDVARNFPSLDVSSIPPNLSFYSDLSEENLYHFYETSSYFLVLSGGEGYCLPAREALSVGVPVIAPRNTVFVEWEGWDGVILIPTKPTYLHSPYSPQQIYRFPVLEEIERYLSNYPNFLREINPPKVAPTIDEFREELLEGVERLTAPKHIRVEREISSLWITYPDAWGLGLGVVSRRYAKLVEGKAVPITAVNLAEISPRCPVVVPFREGLFEVPTPWGGNNIRNLITFLTNKLHPRSIGIWLHSEVSPHLLTFFRLLGVQLFTTHPDYAAIIGANHLPNPFGDPTPPDAVDDGYFLVWGCNYTQLDILSKLYYYLHDFPIKVHYAMVTNPPPHIVELLKFWENIGQEGGKWEFLSFISTLEDNELEELINKATGYIILDDDSVALRWEVSAKVPQVLRKGKPVIVNLSKRTEIFKKYIPILPFMPSSPRWEENAARMLRSAMINPQAFIPRNVPSLDDEVELVRGVVELLRGGAKLDGEVI